MKRYLFYIILILLFLAPVLFAAEEAQEEDYSAMFDISTVSPSMMTYESLAIIWESMDNGQKKKTVKMLKEKWTTMSNDEKSGFIGEITKWWNGLSD